jgi:class 3 adenylate cyclase
MRTEQIGAPAIDRDAVRGATTGLAPGVLALLAATGSLVACYGTLLAAGAFGIEMVGWRAHLQAVVMWGLGGVALWAIWTDRAQHGRNLPLAIGAVGVGLILFVLYVHFDQSLEILAYVCLVAAALLNQNSLVGVYARQLQAQTEEIAELNARLEDKIERQSGQIERLDKLRDFLSPKVAELVVEGGEAELFDSHRRYIACLFCDIRNFTAFTEAAEPEDTIAVLQAFHTQIGELAGRHNGTIGFRAGDGVMVFFNDPIPCEHPVQDALDLAGDIRAAVTDIRGRWERLGFSFGIGIGIAAGYATLGLIGAKGGAGYTAIGNPVNIAARLCDLAQDNEILLDQRAYLDVEHAVTAEAAEPRQLKGVSKPVETWRVTALPGAPSGGVGHRPAPPRIVP